MFKNKLPVLDHLIYLGFPVALAMTWTIPSFNHFGFGQPGGGDHLIVFYLIQRSYAHRRIMSAFTISLAVAIPILLIFAGITRGTEICAAPGCR